jgi:hypothetical protein
MLAMGASWEIIVLQGPRSGTQFTRFTEQKYKYGHLRSCAPGTGTQLSLLALLVQKYKY